MAKVDFCPMPKRFMVWDKEDEDWLQGGMVFQLSDIKVLDQYCSYDHDINSKKFCQFIICQSINLFDKDDEEIFEGSIINVYENYNFGNGDNERDFDGVVVCHDGCWSVNSWNGEDEIIQPLYEILPEHITLIGHILSNPELLEEK